MILLTGRMVPHSQVPHTHIKDIWYTATFSLKNKIKERAHATVSAYIFEIFLFLIKYIFKLIIYISI